MRPDATIIYRGVDSFKGAGSIAVLTFHGVPDPRASYVSSNPEDFRKFLDYLRDQRYKVIALRDLAEYVDPSKGPADPYSLNDQGQPFF